MKLREEILNEFYDFCKYGYCLEEETAKDYLKFLIDALAKLGAAKGEKAMSNVGNHIRINNNRFVGEVKRLKKIGKADYDFFEERSLYEFEADFEKVFNQLKTQHTLDGKRKIPSKWIEWIQDSFNNYVARFEKRDPAVDPDFRKFVSWKDKNYTANSGKYLPSKSKK